MEKKDNKKNIHLGHYIKEMMDDRSIKSSELAKQLNISENTLNKLIRGELPLSKALAMNLAKAFGTPVDVWYKSPFN